MLKHNLICNDDILRKYILENNEQKRSLEVIVPKGLLFYVHRCYEFLDGSSEYAEFLFSR